MVGCIPTQAALDVVGAMWGCRLEAQPDGVLIIDNGQGTLVVKRHLEAFYLRDGENGIVSLMRRELDMMRPYRERPAVTSPDWRFRIGRILRK